MLTDIKIKRHRCECAKYSVVYGSITKTNKVEYFSYLENFFQHFFFGGQNCFHLINKAWESLPIHSNRHNMIQIQLIVFNKSCCLCMFTVLRLPNCTVWWKITALSKMQTKAKLLKLNKWFFTLILCVCMDWVWVNSSVWCQTHFCTIFVSVTVKLDLNWCSCLFWFWCFFLCSFVLSQ